MAEEDRRTSSDEEDIRLWTKYKETGNPAIREKLILRYSSFVKYVAGRMAVNLPSNVEYDDLVGYGVFGLMDAIEKYDPDRSIKFKTYAKTRIRGAILDELRGLDWIPRSVRQKGRDLERAYAELEPKLGREATDEEVCDYLKIDRSDLYKRLDETRLSMMSSLDETDPDGDGTATRMDFLEDQSSVSPQRSAERQELARILAQEITCLTDRERLVITLYYFEELTSKEIARVLEVSDSRVSQLHTRALLRLRNRLGKDDREALMG